MSDASSTPVGRAGRRPPGPTAGRGRLLVAALGAALFACGPALTPLGARVQVAKSVSPVDCHVIGEVDGAGGSPQRAEARLRNAAGELHANQVVITESLDNGGSIRMHGQAFGCRPPLF